MKSLIIVMIFISVAAAPALTYANWGGAGNYGSFGSGHLEAIGTSQIELLDEDLRIDLYKDHALVVVEYTFHNTGSDVLVKAGFPNIIYRKKDEISDYRIEADGAEMQYKHTKGGIINYIPLPENLNVEEDDRNGGKLKISWLVSEVQFKEGETKKIKIHYNSHYQMSAGGYSDDTDFDPEIFRYLLSTGATWKGPIKKGTVTITAVSAEPDKFILKPDGKFEHKNDTFTWKFNNLKPTRADNILIDFNNPVSIKMNYHPDDQFGLSYYILQDKQNKYYYASHSYSVQASSTLKPEARYSPDNVKDMKASTAWAEGKEGDGIGEYLLLKLKQPQVVSQIGIIPGYAKSQEAYFNNNRIAQITAIVNGTYKVTSTFKDEYVSYHTYHPKAYQYIDISGYKNPINTIKLVIDKVYPGTKYHDTCISEIILQKQYKYKPSVQGAR